MLFEAHETQKRDRTCQGVLILKMKLEYIILKVLWLYLDIRIIGYTFCSMLNEKALQK